MPQPRRARKQAEPQEPEDEVEEESADEEEPDEDEQVEQQSDAELNVRIRRDVVEIDLPRDGNERKALEGVASMLEGLS